ncbi:MAG: prenyltransferase/squalene oxidase repeat-containing protein [Pirellulaceae bacterium]
MELNQLQQAYQKLLSELRHFRGSNGEWAGQLSSSALATATAVSALSFYVNSQTQPRTAAANSDSRHRVEKAREQIQRGIESLSQSQNDDGGWGDTAASYSNISTTLLAIAAFHTVGLAQDYSGVLAKADSCFREMGGIDGIRRRYGVDRTFSVPILANAAMAGLVPWREVSALPFEATLVPQKFYHLMQLPVVSYAIPALVAIGQVKFVKDPPLNPLSRILRRAAIGPSLRLLEKMQPSSGGFLEAVPLTSFVTMGLINAEQHSSPVIERGVDFLLASMRDDGTWPIDTNLATWNTTLTINALANNWTKDFSDSEWLQTLKWLLSCQHNTRHPFTNAAPGGWGWTDLSGAVPDSDDTPGAILALSHLRQQMVLEPQTNSMVEAAAERGVKWLLGIQNRDGGWPTFCCGWGRLPFDRSGSDITAHVIRGLLAWRGVENAKSIDRAVEAGFRFLAKRQRADGSWLPLWFGNQDQPDDENPCYGTAKVLLAYIAANRLDTKAAGNGLNWIRENQHATGGWGGGPSIRRLIPALGCGSLEETALCVETLALADRPVDRPAIDAGGDWLIQAIKAQEYRTSRPIGFYFAKLWYDEKHYPLVFGLSAVGRLIARASRTDVKNKIVNGAWTPNK